MATVINLDDYNYKNSQNIASNLLKTIRQYIQEGTDFYLQENSKTISVQQFVYSMHRGTRHHYFNSVIQDGKIISEKELDMIRDFIVIETGNGMSAADQIYNSDDRIGTWQELLKTKKLIIDTSPTGSGKSHDVGLLKRKHFKPIDVDKIKVIMQSPLNTTVPTLKKWKLKIGRNNEGWVYDDSENRYRQTKSGEIPDIIPNCIQAPYIRKLGEAYQITSVRNNVCRKCSMQESCSYLSHEQKLSRNKYVRTTLSSIGSLKDNLIIIDDFGSLDLFITLTFSQNDIHNTFKMCEKGKYISGRWGEQLPELKNFLTNFMEILSSTEKRSSDVIDLILAKIDPEDIDTWLRLPEPDRIVFHYLDIGSDGIFLNNQPLEKVYIKRIIFLILMILSGKLKGEIYYDSQKKNFCIKTIKPIFRRMIEESAGILILDATANKNLIKHVFGIDPYIISSSGDPFKNITVKVIQGLPNSYKGFLHYNKGFNWKAKMSLISEFIDQDKKKSGLITYKELLGTRFRKYIDKRLVLGYNYFHDRASNVFYEKKCTRLFSIGPSLPNLYSCMGESFRGDINNRIYVARPYNDKFIIRKEAADPFLRQYIQYKTNSAYIQMAGRLRSIRHPRKKFELVIMDNLALPFQIDEFIKVDARELARKSSTGRTEKELSDRKLRFFICCLEELKENNIDKLTINVLKKLQRKGITLQTLSEYTSKIGDCNDIKTIIKLLKKQAV